MKTINIPLPKIGESTTEAKIVEWLKKPGVFQSSTPLRLTK